MDLTLLAYPFLFLALYFEAFLLVTFLSSPAAKSRARTISSRTPTVAMIVPCYNEEKTVGATADSLLALDYPADKLRIVLVDDGSTDGTGTIMDTYAENPRVTVIHQKNGGKHTALNAGIAAATDAELIGCLDADSFVERSALLSMIPCFDDDKVGAATAAMSVHKPSTMVERMQNAEYVLGIALRHILATVNGLHVTPGPFSLYRRDLVTRLGGFQKGYNTEDMEMALRIQRAGFSIDCAPSARVYTSAPRSIPALVKQRVRWTTGFLKNVMYDYRDLVGNPRFGALGLMVLPLGFVAVVGGLGLSLVAVYELARRSMEAYATIAGVPLSYILSTMLPSATWLSWFYFPMTLFVMLTILTLAGSVLLMFIGKRISATPGELGLGIVAYALAYGLIAPFWLLRSVADVAINYDRSWR
jgi:cellulose synthase/poly-beta-1,6-N-acetylglucosamine synthase-like glycosyltransferase